MITHHNNVIKYKNVTKKNMKTLRLGNIMTFIKFMTICKLKIDTFLR